jgi:hypothetical protein
MWKPLSIILGIILIAFGAVSLLNELGIINIGLTLPTTILIYILAGGGLVILAEGLFPEGWAEPAGKISILVGILILAFGILMVLSTYGIIPFAIPDFSLLIYNVLFIIEGLLLLWGAHYLLD